ncbi:uncharacterized protein LOC111256752 [Setaria italica]|uniref:uncharacterized protein LOC111256752 n=1 Tax=Setaria italica TaxID=4555 RepID=UPI000BE6270E|nr:uncharacterized protein LOC111256752 [Setaria italica]
MEMLTPMNSPFYGIIPGNTAIPIGQVFLPVTFGTKENYRTEYIQFEVADPETSYHAILGRPVHDHPALCVLSTQDTGTKGVLSLHGDLKRSYECDTEAIELAATSQVPNSTQQVFAASEKLSAAELKIPEKKLGATKVKLASDMDIKVIDLETSDTSKTALIGSGLDPI